MSKGSSSILGPIKKIIFIVLTAIFLILIAFLYLLTMTRHREFEDKTVINIFGKQRAYTQMISKDASRIYVLYLAREKDYSVRIEEEIDSKIMEVKDDLSMVRDKFTTTLKSIHDKKLTVDDKTIKINSSLVDNAQTLKEIDNLWNEFDIAIQTVEAADSIDSDMTDALVFINNNNMELMQLCDDFQNQILKESLTEDKTRQTFAYVMIAVLIAVILYSLYRLQRNLIRPFSQLYRGITEIGLDSQPIKRNLPTKKTITPIVSEINDMFHKINYLISLIENINNNDSFMETLNFISNTFSSFIPYNYIGIGLISEDRRFLKASYGVSDGTIVGFPERIMGTSWLINETSLGDLMEKGETRIINDLEAYCEDKPLKLYNKVLLEAGVRASISLPLFVSDEPVGVIFFSSTGKNVYTAEHMKFLKTLANSIAISLNKNIFVNDILFSSILALAKLAEARDEDTGEHLDRMAVYSRTIAELLYENNCYSDEITLEYIDNIERFSPLHDIGKVGIRDGILLKPGGLTPEEFVEMKRHAGFGADVLKTAEKNMQKHGKNMFGMGIEIAEGHHERWDGSGYPNGKKGTEIPLSARIVALADVFDALTSKRPYKEAFTFLTAIELIREGRGKHFDPLIVDVFMASQDKIERLYNKFKGHPEIDEDI